MAKAKLAFPDGSKLLSAECALFRAKLEARNKSRYDGWRKAIQTPEFADDLHLPAGDQQQTQELRELATARPWEMIIKRRQP